MAQYSSQVMNSINKYSSYLLNVGTRKSLENGDFHDDGFTIGGKCTHQMPPQTFQRAFLETISKPSSLNAF